jgi:phenylacetate-CoA ligase
VILVRNLRRRRFRQAVAERAAALEVEPAEAERAQLAALNAQWAETIRCVPYYRALASRREVPASFGSLAEFSATVPPSRRGEIRDGLADRTSDSPAPDFFRITGGTTAEPIQLPAWESERAHTSPDIWVARGWYGVDPGSRLFLLWGHSHLLGAGLGGKVNAWRRRVADSLLGYRRFSAYDLDTESLRQAADELIRFRPDYVLGYSVALDLFRQANAERAAELAAVQPRLVIAAAEGFPAADCMDRLAELFAAPVGMEYGSVETDLIAHTHPGGGFRVMWRTYILEADAPDEDGVCTVRVTSLYPRCFPLVRYEHGDRIERNAGDDAGTVLRFRRVLGRSNDFVELQDGSRIHSEAFTHAVRPCEAVASYQVAVEGPLPRLRVVLRADLSEDMRRQIRARLGRIHPLLTAMPIDVVPRLEQTRAGKAPMILRRRPAPGASERGA